MAQLVGTSDVMELPADTRIEQDVSIMESGQTQAYCLRAEEKEGSCTLKIPPFDTTGRQFVDPGQSYSLYYPGNNTSAETNFNFTIVDVTIGSEDDMWSNYSELFTLRTVTPGCVRFAANSKRQIPSMNLRNLTVPITSYDQNKKKYYSPVLCAMLINYYPAQLLTEADQELRYICDMTTDERNKIIMEKHGDNSSYIIN